MMRDVLERFGYRFQIWRREQREDWIGPPDTHLPNFREYMHEASATARPRINWEDPKFKVMLTESTPNFVVREVSVYFGIVIILSAVGRLIDTFIPTAHFVVFVAFVVLVCVWTLVSIRSGVNLAKRRRAYRAHGSNII